MTNEEKILSMLDLIATQITRLMDTNATKGDLQNLKDELRNFKEQTTDRINKLEAENSAAHEAIITKIDDQSELLAARFDVLNDRLFNQETQLNS